ncbi:MAG TPA: hypothetical protein VKA91_04440 [Nitrososphaeraceae archaeon]|nr:hypothetical protein [Nitrososphaeraceae archaeon]
MNRNRTQQYHGNDLWLRYTLDLVLKLWTTGVIAIIKLIMKRRGRRDSRLDELLDVLCWADLISMYYYVI